MGRLSYSQEVLRHHAACAPDVQSYFQHVPELANSTFPWEVLIAYLFMQLEKGHNRAIHGSVVKLHRANAEVVSSVLDTHRMTRSDFVQLIRTITGKDLPKEIHDKLKRAEAIRDRCVHGKEVKEAKVLQAVKDVLEYVEGFNAHMKSIAGFRPFGDMRGYKGRMQLLDKATSRWLLIGLGLLKKDD